MRVKVFLIITAIIVTILLTILLVSQQSTYVTAKQPTGSIPIEDMCGRKVEVPKNVEKVATLLPSDLRIVVMLGAVDKVCGISSYFGDRRYMDKLEDALAYPELLKVEKIGTGAELDLEKIAEIKPDVFFIDSSYAHLIEKIEGTGTKVICLKTSVEMGNFSELFSSIRIVGRVLNKEKRADEVIEYIEKKVKNVTDRLKNVDEKPKVYLANWAYRYGVGWTVRGYAPVNLVAKNVAENISAHYMEVTKEQIIEWNPDFIFIHGYKGYSAVEEILKDKSLQGVEAVKNKRVFGLFGPYIGYDPKTMMIDLYIVAKTLFPEKFADVDVLKTGEEVFEFFYGEKGKEVFKQMMRNRGIYLSEEVTPLGT
ncbi:MAG: ABC transporter substrate-binding protein [Archaeoglobaceae archaeon]